ncbi:unnamed protein product [Hymenolepis diminuta]|uniref:Uncharacterized protein n=1 Tax=Hymenolepis diminuta TaxID=6216 RepID=A0A564YG24_HYMDI|nr:unnamed protein product [Hymenolepis diminuta]
MLRFDSDFCRSWTGNPISMSLVVDPNLLQDRQLSMRPNLNNERALTQTRQSYGTLMHTLVPISNTVRLYVSM